MAIQKLVSIRNFAHQDSEPCCVLDGLYLGIDSSPSLYRSSGTPVLHCSMHQEASGLSRLGSKNSLGDITDCHDDIRGILAAAQDIEILVRQV